MPDIHELPEKLVVGIGTRTRNELEADPATSTISDLWSRFFAENIGGQVPNPMPQPVLYGVYTDYESDQDGAYTLVVGMESSEAAELPGALLAARIHPGRYMVFQRNGSMPDVAFRTWQEVWNYFDENDDYERAYTTDFEQYVDENGITIYIAIKD